jgi:Glycosyl hydrolase family 71
MAKAFNAARYDPPVSVPPPAAGSPKMVFAHYFPPYPLSKDDLPATQDYYTTQYLPVDGEHGKHAAYGGFFRDRPLPVTPTSGDWAVANQQTDVRNAIAAGINGFSVDILSTTSPNWTATLGLLQAAHNVNPNFAVMAMPDMTSLGVNPGQLASALATFATYPAAYHLRDGRLVVSPFKAEAQTPSWWLQVFSILATTYHIHVAFVPLLLNFPKYEGAFAPISYGLSNWGPRSPSTDATSSFYASIAHLAGKLWMQPVSVQDERPYSGLYTESDNTANLRNTWHAAIRDDAQWVQLVTWNDFSEGSQIEPSENNGWSYLNISSYYIQRFLTGRRPAITHDLAVLTYRTQPVDATTEVSESDPMTLLPGSSPARNDVEMLTILTKPARVHVTVGGHGYTYDAPAGLFTVDFPLQVGGVHASLHRLGHAILSTAGRGFAVADPTYRQDLSYHAITLAPVASH